MGNGSGEMKMLRRHQKKMLDSRNTMKMKNAWPGSTVDWTRLRKEPVPLKTDQNALSAPVWQTPWGALVSETGWPLSSQNCLTPSIQLKSAFVLYLPSFLSATIPVPVLTFFKSLNYYNMFTWGLLIFQSCPMPKDSLHCYENKQAKNKQTGQSLSNLKVAAFFLL